MKTKTIYILPILLFLITSKGCVDDERIATSEYNVLETTLSFEVPPSRQSETKSLTETDEQYFETIDILVFKTTEGSETETYLYNTQGRSIVNEGGIYGKSCVALLRVCEEPTERHRIAIFINLRQEIESVKASFEGLTKEEIYQKIQINTTGKWQATDPVRYLPMWGEAANVHYITQTSDINLLGNIPILRSLSRIDVGLSMDSQGNPTANLSHEFQLNQVKVYYPRTQALAAPAPEVYDDGYKKVTAPSIPENATANPIPHSYIVPYDAYGVVREIYVAETRNETSATDSPPLAILLEGSYKGEKPSWYKIDIYDREATTGFVRLDLLRNHRYFVNITGVKGSGFPTEEEALESDPGILTSEIIPWNEYNSGDINISGQYTLTVSTEKLLFYREGKPKKLTIYSNHPNGWDIIEQPDWITIIDTQPIEEQTGGMRRELTIEAKEIPETSTGREGHILIKAGNIYMKVILTQSDGSEVTIALSEEILIFRKNPPSSQGIQITTYPTDLELHYADAGKIPSWTTFPNDGDNGYVEFRPSGRGDIATTDTIFSVITIFGEHAGVTASVTLVIQQNPTDLLFDVETDLYDPEEKENIFKVTTDAQDWWASAVTDDTTNPMIKEIIYGRNSENHFTAPEVIPYSNDYRFTTHENPTYRDRQVILTFASDDPDFNVQSHTLRQGHKDPYLEITDPSGYASGLTFINNNPIDVIFRTNAGWTLEAAEGYTGIITRAQLTESGSEIEDAEIGRMYAGSGNALVEYQATLTFTPLSEPRIGTPAAGTTAEATARLTTGNHPGAETVIRPLKFRQTAPSGFTLQGITPENPELPQETTIAFISAYTNDEWKVIVEYPNATQTFDFPATTYGLQSQPIEIQENPYSQPRQVSLYYQYKDNPRIPLIVYTQGRGDLAFSNLVKTDNTETLRKSGETVTLYFTASSNLRFYTRAVALVDNEEKVLSNDELGTSLLRELYIHNNHTTTLRRVIFQYRLEGSDEWENINDMIYIQEQGGLYIPYNYISNPDIKGFIVSVEQPEEEIRQWALAMGISTQYNNVLHGYNNNTGNYLYTPTELTGCGAFFQHIATDPINGQLQWRLPADDEFELLFNAWQDGNIYNLVVGTSGVLLRYPELYWTAREANSGLTSQYNRTIVKGITDKDIKNDIDATFLNPQKAPDIFTYKKYYRCIRKPTEFEQNNNF